MIPYGIFVGQRFGQSLQVIQPVLKSIQPLKGGLLFCGTEYDKSYLSMMDLQGNWKWNLLFPSPGKIQLLSNGDIYLMCSPIDNNGFIVSKIKFNGSTIWSFQLNSRTTYCIMSRVTTQTPDGGSIYVGEYYKTPTGPLIHSSGGIIIKLDSLGAVEWYKFLAGRRHSLRFGSVAVTENGNYLVAGTIGGIWNKIVWFGLFNTTGNLIWQKTAFVDTWYNIYPSSAITNENGVWIAGNASTKINNLEYSIYWLTQLSENGEFNNQKYFIQSRFSYMKFKVLTSGNFIAVGLTGAFQERIALVELNPTGRVIWSMSYDAKVGPFTTICANDVAAHQKGFIIAGYIKPPAYGPESFRRLAISTDEKGKIPKCSRTKIEHPTSNRFNWNSGKSKFIEEDIIIDVSLNSIGQVNVPKMNFDTICGNLANNQLINKS